MMYKNQAASGFTFLCLQFCFILRKLEPKYQKVTADEKANIACSFEKLAPSQRYEFVAQDRADRINQQILATVKAKETQKDVTKKQTLTFAMNKKLNMENVKSVKYTSSNESVATVSKTGKITAKSSGTAVIKASVTFFVTIQYLHSYEHKSMRNHLR